MEFRTKIEIPKSDISISHKTRILMLGSCFIENIGKVLLNNKFIVNLNPFGILYNPLSIQQALQMLLDDYRFAEKDIFEHKGLYHSFFHHGSFSDANKSICLSNINEDIKLGAESLRNSDILIITFGTSYVFRHKEKDIIVGNCHKLPAGDFERYRLSVDTIVKKWIILIKKVRELNPKLQIIFTVSPIRHLKDGTHDNQLSKSTLLLAIDELCKSNPDSCYFPSYEIVLDELRDYRFYAEDMIHPNSTTIKYIWEKFSEIYISKEAASIMEEWNKISLMMNHRSLNTQSDEYKHFLRQTLLKLKAFNNKYPYICCEEEIFALENRL